MRSFVPVILLALLVAAPLAAAAPKDDRPEPAGKQDAPGQAKKAPEAAPEAAPEVSSGDPTPEPAPTPASTAVPTEATQPTPATDAAAAQPAPATDASAPAIRPVTAPSTETPTLAPDADLPLALPLPFPDGGLTDDAGGAYLPRAPFAGSAPESSGSTGASIWRALWWAAPLLGAAGVGAVVLLRRKETPLERAHAQTAQITAPRVARVADATDYRSALRNGQAAVVRGDYLEAIAWFDAALVAVPALAVAHFCRGVCLASMGRTAEAFGALENAIVHDPSEAAYRIHFARVAIAIGRGTDAMAALEPVAAAVPEAQQAMLDDPALAGLRDHPRFLAMCGAL